MLMSPIDLHQGIGLDAVHERRNADAAASPLRQDGGIRVSLPLNLALSVDQAT